MENAQKQEFDCSFVALNAAYIHTSLSVRTLAAYVRPKRAQLIELCINQPFDELRRAIIQADSSLVGFSCYLWNIELALKLAQTLKLCRPEIKIVLGGHEVSHDAHELLARAPFVDAVICGEGEAAWAEMLKAGSLDVAGAVTRNNTFLPAPVVSRWAADCYEAAEHKPRITYYESSRGCPFSCGFCLSGGEKLRFMPEEQATSELVRLGEQNAYQVKLIDRTFNADKSRAKHIWRTLSALDTQTNYHFEIAAELLDDESLGILRAAPKGRFQLEIGVQSTCPAALQAVGRKNDFVKLSRCVHTLMDGGNIHVHLDLIAGLPYEGMTEFHSSFNDVFALRPSMLQLGFLKLLKGSRLRAESEMYDIAYADFPPYEVLKTRWLSPDELMTLKSAERALERFYNAERFALFDYLLRSHDAFELFCGVGALMFSKNCSKTKNALELLLEYCDNSLENDAAAKALAEFDYLRTGRRACLFSGRELLQTAETKAFFRDKAQAFLGGDRASCHKRAQLWCFDCDVFALTKTGEYSARPVWALFDNDTNIVYNIGETL